MLFKKKDVKEKSVKDKNAKDKNVKEKKVTKTTVKSTRKPAAETVKKQTGNTAAKSGKNGNSGKGGKTPDKSDQILSKLMAIEKEARLEQARDQVDRLEDEKIAENLELLLKIMRSEQ